MKWHKNTMLRVTKKYILCASYDEINDISEIELIHPISMTRRTRLTLKESKIGCIEAYDDLFIVAGTKNDRNTSAKLRIYKYGAMKDEDEPGFKLNIELSVSSNAKLVQLDRAKNILIFITDTNHLCFWNIAKRDSRCLCAHNLNVTNYAFTFSLDCIFIASPAQLHIMQMDDICDWNQPHHSNPNNAVDKRMALNIHNNQEKYPFDDIQYLLSSDDEKDRMWQNWAKTRTIKQIKSIPNGVVFYVENQKQFEIVRCDKKRTIRYLKQNQDAKLLYIECKPLNHQIYEQYVP